MLKLNIHSDFLTGIFFPSRNSTNALNKPSQSPPSQTFCNIHKQKRHHLLPEPLRLDISPLRQSGASGTPLSSAWHYRRTCPFPLWPSSWQWDQGLCSVDASAPRLRLASVDRMDTLCLMQPFTQHTSTGTEQIT